jgi:hypothetical protein
MGDHVKILSNEALLEDLLKMASGDQEVFQDRIETNIREIAAKIDWEGDHEDWKNC